MPKERLLINSVVRRLSILFFTIILSGLVYMIWLSMTDVTEAQSEPQSAGHVLVEDSQSETVESVAVAEPQSAQQAQSEFQPLPPVEGAGDIVKVDAPPLTDEEYRVMVSEPAREVASNYLTRRYTYFSTDTDLDAFERGLWPYSTKPHMIYLVNVEEARMQGWDSQHWDVTKIDFIAEHGERTDLLHWQADVRISLRLQDGDTTRSLSGRVAVERAFVDDKIEMRVTDWDVTQ